MVISPDLIGQAHNRQMMHLDLNTRLKRFGFVDWILLGETLLTL
jgi:hypothetical protein